MITRRHFLALAAVASWASSYAWAQQPGRLPKEALGISILQSLSPRADEVVQ